jgi:hypothetical protein
MRVFRLPRMPNSLRGHEDALLVTDSLRPQERERRMSTFPVPEPDGNWLQELQDYSKNSMSKNENCVSFSSSFGGRAPTVPPSIMEEERREDSCGCCCWAGGV